MDSGKTRARIGSERGKEINGIVGDCALGMPSLSPAIRASVVVTRDRTRVRHKITIVLESLLRGFRDALHAVMSNV